MTLEELNEIEAHLKAAKEIADNSEASGGWFDILKGIISVGVDTVKKLIDDPDNQN